MRLFALRLGLLSLIIHAPVHATGKERGVGAAHLVRLAQQDKDWQPLAHHLRILQEITAVPRLLLAAHPGVEPAMRSRLQNARLACPSPQGRQIVAMTEHDLAAMAPYLDQTRRLLKHDTQSTRQVEP